MASKKFWAGILVLVFGMVVVGCEEDHDGEIEVINRTAFNIVGVIFETDNGVIVKDDTDGVDATKKKIYRFSSEFSGKCIVTVDLGPSGSTTVQNQGSLWAKTSKSPEGWTTMSIALTGNSKETFSLR